MQFFKKYITELIWLTLITIFEIGFLSLCLFLISLIPIGISLGPLIYRYQLCFVIIAAYRIITYRINSLDNSYQPQTPYMNQTMYDDSEPQYNPPRNVYSDDEIEDLNNQDEVSVRE